MIAITKNDGIRCPSCKDTPTFGELRQVVYDGERVLLQRLGNRFNFVGRCPCGESLFINVEKSIQIGG